MCGRFTLEVPVDEVADRFKATISSSYLDIAEEFSKPLYNIAPGTYHPIIVQEDDKNTIKFMRWGLVPSWSRDENIGYKMINARSESIANKPSFKKPLHSQRCIVPASGFYEWQKQDKVKQPYYFHLSTKPIFGFAGLYDTWSATEGKELLTYTIITVPPNKDVKPVHDRMPAILQQDSENNWLDPDLDTNQHLQLLKPYQQHLDNNKVSSAVNSPANNTEDLIKPLQEDNTLGLF